MKKTNTVSKVTPIKKANVLQTYRAIVEQVKELEKAKAALKAEIDALPGWEVSGDNCWVLALGDFKAEKRHSYPVRLDTEAVKEFLGDRLEEFQKKATEPTVTLKVI
jgi:hypothetical protein